MSFVVYLGILLYCDVRRPQELGLKLSYVPGGALVDAVGADSPAARAGLRVGDLLTRAGPVSLRTSLDRSALQSRLRFSDPVPLSIVRDGAELRAYLAPTPAGFSFWRTRAGVVLALMRAAQLAMLALAFVILWKQSHDLGATAGAWLLAALSVYCIVPPSRFSAVWHDLPAPFEAAMWFPYLSSVSAGAIVATFYTVFPQRAPHWRLILTSIWTVMFPLLALHVYEAWRAMYLTDDVALSTRASSFSIPANLVCVGLGVLVMVGNYRRLSSPGERRRVRLVLVASCAALISAAVVVTRSVFAPSADLRGGMFSSWPLTLGMLPVLGVPVAFAYAILRHRLFDVSLILRQGLKYALARRFLLSLIPGAALLFVADVATHSGATLSELIGRRIWWYAVIAAGVVWIYHRRHDWLEGLDRRYFRERYNAQQLLGELAESLRRPSQLQDLAPAIVARIEAALHPTYVALLVRSDDGRFYECVGTTGAGQRSLRFPAGDKAMRLLAVLGQPLVVGRQAPRSVFEQLPANEQRALVASETELLVGVPGPGDTVEALLALGVKRSEEPYSREDLDLLSTVAVNLRSALPLSVTSEECDTCGRSYPTGTGRCASDGGVLERSETPRLLAERYVIERRLGRGGMGTVYAARDTQLNRTVAVKLLRERLESARAVERCRREAQAAAALAHPNVVTIHDMRLTGDGRPFLVMELLNGRTLREALADGPMTAGQIRHVFHGVCAALETAHAQTLVHRDLKPENVFLVNGAGAPTAVKLLDFGISTFVNADETTSRSGALQGTPEYASPEQIRGEVPNPSWDIWALGVMAFESIVGMRPVACVSVALSGQAGTVDGRWSEPALQRLTPELAAFFSRALAVDAAARPRTPADFLDGLLQGLN